MMVDNKTAFLLTISCYIINGVSAYVEKVHALKGINPDIHVTDMHAHCLEYAAPTTYARGAKNKNNATESLTETHKVLDGMTVVPVPKTTREYYDPLSKYQENIDYLLFGTKSREVYENSDKTLESIEESNNEDVALAHYPDGQVLRGELYQNRSAVHLPLSSLVHRGHCHLKITNDLLQTALNAFAILLYGNREDVLRLPPSYVLQSSRTIAMMKIPREKLVDMWTVVKSKRQPWEIPYETLEMYRPLFKYINGREMSRLNLLDNRILTYIGTHPDLNRHQVGVVANRYIQLNPKWTQATYLNLMNNLLCGVTMINMRKIPSNTYLQLTHQVFYHIRACDPLQRRFFLAMMTKTQALGKSYSWSARDVSRLGLLLAEVDGPALSAINPEAMSGITAQVMMQIPAQNLRHITEMQLRYIGQKPLGILARKLKMYQDQLNTYSNGNRFEYLKLSFNLLFALFIIN